MLLLLVIDSVRHFRRASMFELFAHSVCVFIIKLKSGNLEVTFNKWLYVLFLSVPMYLKFWLQSRSLVLVAFVPVHYLRSISVSLLKGTSRQRSGKGAIRKRFPLQKPRWEKTKPTIRYLYHETYRKPNEQLFSQ